MATTSQPQAGTGSCKAPAPIGPWSIMSIRAWVHGMGTVQVPEFGQLQPKDIPQPPPLPEVDSGARGVTKYQLELQSAGLAWEWKVQQHGLAQGWSTTYRRDFVPAWQAVKVPLWEGPGVGPKANSGMNRKPDPLLVVIPTDQVEVMLRQAASMLVLQPAKWEKANDTAEIKALGGPCLTIVDGFIQIVAHLMVDGLPTLPLDRPKEGFSQAAVEEIHSALGFTEHRLGQGNCWIMTQSCTPDASIVKY